MESDSAQRVSTKHRSIDTTSPCWVTRCEQVWATAAAGLSAHSIKVRHGCRTTSELSYKVNVLQSIVEELRDIEGRGTCIDKVY